MAISHIGAASAVATTISIPAHQAGDLLVIFAYANSGNTPPAAPSGWSLIAAGTGANTNASAVGYRFATASGTASGVWSGANHLCAAVYRGCSGVGAFAGAGANNSSSVSYPALTGLQSSGSWVVGVAGHKTSSAVETAPTGMVNRTSTATSGESALHDTGGSVTAWAATNANVAASGAYRSWTLEILAASGALARIEVADGLASSGAVGVVGAPRALAPILALETPPLSTSGHRPAPWRPATTAASPARRRRRTIFPTLRRQPVRERTSASAHWPCSAA